MSGRSNHFLGITSTFRGVNVSCSRTQHGGCRSRTPDLSLRSPRLYHSATALPLRYREPTLDSKQNVIYNEMTCLIAIYKLYMSIVMRKTTFCICETKDADQFRGNREADQRLCFRYTDSTIPLLPKSEISSL